MNRKRMRRNSHSSSDLQFLKKRFLRILELLGHADSGWNARSAISILLPSVAMTACASKDGEPQPPQPATPPPATKLNDANPNYIEPSGTTSVTIIGTVARNVIVTGQGDDIIRSGDGDDLINAGSGNDVIDAGAGDDTIVIAGRNLPSDAFYRAYTPADLINPRGSGKDVSQTVTLSNLLTNSQDYGAMRIDGGAGINDTIIIYGRVDLSGVDLQGIEQIIINSDVTLAAEQIAGITAITAGDGAILRLTGTGAVSFSAVVRTDLRHIEVGKNVVLEVPNGASLAGTHILSGTGTVSVMADENVAFSGIRLAEGLHLEVNAGSGGVARAETVAIGAPSNAFGGVPVQATDILPSGGVLIDGLNDTTANRLTGTGNADLFNLGAADIATGNGGDDLFVLPETGTAAITDFQAGDILRLTGITESQIASAIVASEILTVTLQSGVARTFMLTGVADGNLRIEDSSSEINSVALFINQVPISSGDHALTLNEGASYALTTADLFATDADNGAAQLVWQVMATPANGQLVLTSASTTPITSFTQQQLAAGSVAYVHDGSETTTDRFTVQVTDAQGASAMVAIVSVAITPVDDAPTAVTLMSSMTTLAEDIDTTASIKIADIAVTDPDGGSRSLELAGADAAMFELNAAQTELLLKSGASLDFEADEVLDVTVRFTGDTAIADSVMISITDVDEAPVIVANQRFVITNTAINGHSVGHLNVDDPENSDSLVFSITGGNTGQAFTTDNEGLITVADATQLSMDAIASYSLIVQVIDGAHTVIGDVQISVMSTSIPPTALSLSGTIVPSGEQGWVIGRLSAMDSDGGENPILTYTSNHASFEVAGEFLKLKPGISINADTTVGVTVADAGRLTTQQTFTIHTLTSQDGMDSNTGRDTLTAISSGQVLRGLGGSDTLIGSASSDIIDGGQHDDTLTGSGGADVFVYRFDSGSAAWGGSGADTITDFNPGEGDKLLFIDSGAVSSLQEFKDAYPTSSSDSSYRVSVLDASTAQIIFAGTDSSDAANSISGTNSLTIDFESAIDTSLYDAGNGQFNSIDGFITALGGEDALLFG